MKNKLLYILFGAAVLVALTACEPKFEYKWTSYVVMSETSVSIAEDDSTGVLTLAVTAYAKSGAPKTDVSFRLVDGDGDNGAKQSEGDYSIISPAGGMLYFDGESTCYIQIQISDHNVGIYTGRKTFYVELIDATDGFDVGGAYKTTVTITDSDKNLEATGIVGTYIAEGYGRISGGYGDATWEMTVIQHPSDPSLFYVYNITPYAGGLDVEEGGEEYWAYGYYGDATEETFLIPSQVCTGRVSTTSGGTYYLGYTPCTEYDGSSFYYSRQYPPVTFYMQDADTWESDYGIFNALCSEYDITTFESYLGVVAPTIKITKID